jgi:hypothetical protein
VPFDSWFDGRSVESWKDIGDCAVGDKWGKENRDERRGGTRKRKEQEGGKKGIAEQASEKRICASTNQTTMSRQVTRRKVTKKDEKEHVWKEKKSSLHSLWVTLK